MSKINGKKLVIKKVDTASMVKYVGVFYATIGVFIGIIIAFSETLYALGYDVSFFKALGMGVITGIFSIILFPLFAFLVGALHGLIFAAVFNIVTEAIGGLSFQTK